MPLGVLLKNEDILEDMVDILDGLQKYIPTTTSIQKIDVCTEDENTRTVDIDVHHFSHIPFGGDQLTVSRIRGSQRILFNSENGRERLEGFIPVIEDWHTKMCFMEVNMCTGYKGIMCSTYMKRHKDMMYSDI